MARSARRSRSSTSSPATRRRRRPKFPWKDATSEELLDLRLRDLGVKLEGSWLERPIERVRREMRAKGLRIRPHFWLSDEWFSPAGVPGVAIPFYLAHPRLMRLERRQMLEVEGGTLESCLKLLRHEVGHVMQHAYELHRRRRWQETFGYSSQPYPERYRPNPASRQFVQHLDAWYAQAHPDEDFAETFAVWMTPRSRWRERYHGWSALRKLEYVDELMQEIGPLKPRRNSRVRPDSLPRLEMTLREYYRRKRERYAVGYSDTYDRDLLRLFAQDGRGPTASSFLRKHRREIRELVSRWTGEYQFTLDQVLKEMIGRCRELKLRAAGSERRLKLDFAILLTVHTTHYVYRVREWHSV